MRQLKLASALLVLTTLSWAAPPGKLDFPPLKYSPPKIERAVLKCGATVFLLPDHELPLINLSAMVRTGSMFEPADKTGLAGLAGSLLRGGGTLTRSREEMDELLEFIGASVETGMDVESAAASLSCLKKDFSKTLGIFSILYRYVQEILGFVIGFSPFLTFEARHGFPNTKTIINFMFSTNL